MMNKKTLVSIVAILGILTLITGVTVAFFNYTRTGSANSIAVGRIYFNTTQNGSITFSNVFPISSTDALTDTTNAKTMSITVVGDTDYDKGIEYLVTASDVNMNVGNKQLPLTIEISTTGTGLGTAETGNYYANRNSYTTSKYKVEYKGTLEEGSHILVGYIAPNATSGTIEGINGTINFKAYIDKDRIAISDTYDGTESDNMGTTTEWVNNRTVFTTTEWNSISGNTSLSFKIKVEANEGIWVEKEVPTPVVVSNSCFGVDFNEGMTGGYANLSDPNVINACTTYLSSHYDTTEYTSNYAGMDYDECQDMAYYVYGTDFDTLAAEYTNGYDIESPPSMPLEDYEYFVNNEIINNASATGTITNYDENCGTAVAIPSAFAGVTITSIGLTAFENSNLESISIPNTVISIDEHAFSFNQLTNVIIPNNVITIETSAFQDNIISRLTLGNSVETIGDNAFANNQLISLTIPNSVTTIDEYAFYGNNINNLTLGNSVETIGNWAFSGYDDQ